MSPETVRAAAANLLRVVARAVVQWVSAKLPTRASGGAPAPRRDSWSPVALPAPRLTDMGLAEHGSVIPPNVERAVRAVLSTSGRITLEALELERFLRGLGLHRGDARGVVLRSTAKLGRSQFAAADLPDVQELVTRAWIDGHAARDQETFLSRLGLELGVELRLELDAATLAEARARVAQALVTRGWSSVAAATLVEQAIGRAASVLVTLRADRSRAA